MQMLRLAEVKAKGLEAYEAGKLTAQHPDPANRWCVYADGEYRCVIGAALNDETLALIRERNAQTKSIAQLETAGIVACDELAGLRDLQDAYDAWAPAARENAMSEVTREREEHFVSLLKA